MSSSANAILPHAIDATKPSASAAQSGEFRLLFRRYRWRVLFTYALFNLENLLRLAQPLLLGWAINGLLRSSTVGLIVFACGQMAHMLLRTIRQMYDTRVFARIYADRASELVADQRGGGIDVSRVAARSALAQQFVEFFERHVPIVIRSLYSIVGAVVMLALFDWMLVVFCLALMIPAGLLNFVYGRRTLRLSGLLHDDLEREVYVLEGGDEQQVRQHYQRTAGWRVKLSDWEAATAAVMEIFVLALMVGALVRFCSLPGVAAGDIFAVFRYVLMFVMAIDSAPLLVGSFSRLRDIGKRMRVTKQPGSDAVKIDG